MVQVVKVWCEHHEPNTIGIGESRPRISWTTAGEERDWQQTSYEIEVTHLDGSLRDSVKVDSSDSRLVPWPGKALTSREQVNLRVRVSGVGADAAGIVSSNRSEGSAPIRVEAGLLQPEDWKCSLIEPNESTEILPEKRHRPITFRRHIQCPIDVAIAHARLYITAHGIYEARINDSRVGDHILAPGWTSYQSRLTYQTYDITSNLASGQDNEIQVDVAEGWFCGSLAFTRRHNIYGSRLGLIAMVVVELENKETICIGSDDRWCWAHGPIIEAGLLDGEAYDARKMLHSQTVWKNVQTNLEFPSSSRRLTAPDGPPIRKTQEFEVREIIKSPSGKTILDFGQNFAGWIKVKQVDGAAGTTIKFQFAEVLEKGEIGTRPLRSAKCLDTLILDGNGPITWEPKFTFHGFRYVEVTGWPEESTTPLTPQRFVGVVIHTDMQVTGSFRCSNPLLNQLHSNIVWSMRGNFVGIPTDCPQRDERLGWTGDINVFGDTAAYLFDVSGMLTSWLKDMMIEQKEAGGAVPLVIPYILGDFGPGKSAEAVWGDVAVMLPWKLYTTTGDISLLVRHYESMKDWLNAIPRSETTGLWKQDGYKLADWLDPSAPPDDPVNAMTDMYMVCDSFLIYVTALMVKIAATLNKSREEQKFYQDEATKLRQMFADEYITPSGRLACDTQTAYALAIEFDLFSSPQQQTHAAERLSMLICQRNKFKIATGFAGTPYLGHALTKVGKSNVFYRMLLHRECPSWLYPVTMGATTVWERWNSMLPDGSINPGDMTSFNHYALGSVASWMHQTICGLKPIDAGWKTFKVEPIPGGNLQWAEAEYHSVYGHCRVRWEIKNNPDKNQPVLWLEVVVPLNTQCHVHLPGSKDSFTVGSGIREWEVDYHPEEWPVRALLPPFKPADDELPADEVLQHNW